MEAGWTVAARASEALVMEEGRADSRPAGGQGGLVTTQERSGVQARGQASQWYGGRRWP